MSHPSKSGSGSGGWSSGLGGIAGASVVAGVGGVSSEAACTWGGVTYASGETIEMDCATCVCESGSVACLAIDLCSAEQGGAAGAAGVELAGAGGWSESDITELALAGAAGLLTADVLGTWYFEIPTGALRWYQLAVCSDGRALQLTSLSGSGAPDQEQPVVGRATALSAAKVQVQYPADESGEVITAATLGYRSSDDSVDFIDESGVAVMRGVRLSDELSAEARLDCDG